MKKEIEYETLVFMNNGAEPCTLNHFYNCMLWIKQKFGYKARASILADNIIKKPGYGHNEIFKKTNHYDAIEINNAINDLSKCSNNQIKYIIGVLNPGFTKLEMTVYLNMRKKDQ